jgi:hypothetical protein
MNLFYYIHVILHNIKHVIYVTCTSFPSVIFYDVIT